MKTSYEFEFNIDVFNDFLTELKNQEEELNELKSIIEEDSDEDFNDLDSVEEDSDEEDSDEEDSDDLDFVSDDDSDDNNDSNNSDNETSNIDDTPVQNVRIIKKTPKENEDEEKKSMKEKIDEKLTFIKTTRYSLKSDNEKYEEGSEWHEYCTNLNVEIKEKLKEFKQMTDIKNENKRTIKEYDIFNKSLKDVEDKLVFMKSKFKLNLNGIANEGNNKIITSFFEKRNITIDKVREKLSIIKKSIESIIREFIELKISNKAFYNFANEFKICIESKMIEFETLQNSVKFEFNIDVFDDILKEIKVYNRKLSFLKTELSDAKSAIFTNKTNKNYDNMYDALIEDDDDDDDEKTKIPNQLVFKKPKSNSRSKKSKTLSKRKNIK